MNVPWFIGVLLLVAQVIVASARVAENIVEANVKPHSCTPLLGQILQSGNGGNRSNECRDTCANTSWPSPHHTSSGRRQLGEQHPWRAAEAHDQEWFACQSDHSRSTRGLARRCAADLPLHKTKHAQHNNTCTYHTVFPSLYPDSMLLYDTCCTYVLPHSHPEPSRLLPPATLPTPTRRENSKQVEASYWGQRLGVFEIFWGETRRSRRAINFGNMLWELFWETFSNRRPKIRDRGFVTVSGEQCLNRNLWLSLGKTPATKILTTTFVSRTTTTIPPPSTLDASPPAPPTHPRTAPQCPSRKRVVSFIFFILCTIATAIGPSMIYLYAIT